MVRDNNDTYPDAEPQAGDGVTVSDMRLTINDELARDFGYTQDTFNEVFQ